MTAVSIFRKLYRVHIYSVLSGSVLLGFIYFFLLPQPFEPVILDAPFRLIAAILLLLGSFGLVLEVLLSLAQSLSRSRKTVRKEEGFGQFFLPTYEPLDRTRKPKSLADTIRKNRASEVRLVKDFAAGNGRLLQISGQAGLGKSSLAALIARRTDFWLNLSGRQIGSIELVRLLAEWLGAGDIRAKAAADEIGSREISQLCESIAEKPTRIFFNGFDSILTSDGRFIDGGLKELFNALLNYEGAHKLILMSRRMLSAEITEDLNTTYLPLEGLNETAANSLLSGDELLGGSFDVGEIVHHSGGNPLLITLLPPIVQRVAFEEIDDVQSWFLNEDESALSGRFLSLAAAEDLTLLQLLSLVPEPMTQSFIEALASAVSSDVEAVGRLKSRRLIEWDAGLKKFSLHPAVRAGAYHTLRADVVALNEAQGLLAEVCIAKAADFKPEDKWVSISDCRLLLRAANLLKASGEISQASELGDRLRPHLAEWGEARLADVLFREEAEEDPLAGSLNDVSQQTAAAGMLRRRGTAFLKNGKVGAAIEEFHALHILASKYRRGHDRLFAAGRLTELYAEIGNLKFANNYGQKQLRLAQSTGDASVIGAAVGRVGHVFMAAGDYAGAEKYYSAAAKRFQYGENIGGEAKAMGLLMRASFLLGQRDKAAQAANSCIDLFNLIGKNDDALLVRRDLADLYRRSGETESANAVFKDIVFQAKKTKQLSIAIDALQELAKAAFSSGDYARTLLLQQDRLELSESLGNERAAGTSLGMIAHCYVRTKDIPSALKHYDEARKRFKAAGYRRGVARCGHFSARLLASEERWKDALSAVLSSLDYSLENESDTRAVDLRVLKMCKNALGEAAFEQMGADLLGDERFAAVLGLMQ